MDDRLEVLDVGFERGLAVVAHPDDLEYGTSSAIARWTAEGHRFADVLVTRGEAGLAIPPAPTPSPSRSSGPERRAPGAPAAGVSPW